MSDDLPAGELDTDPVTVRNLEAKDLDAITRIDAHAMRRARPDFIHDRVHAALHDGRLHTSLVAELDGMVVGYLMAHIHYGEFGRVEPTAVVDMLGVHPEFRGRRVAKALMRQFLMNARAIGVENIRTEVAWNNFELLRFFHSQGFAPSTRLLLERRLG